MKDVLKIKTTEQIVYLNNYKQMYSYEQQSFYCMPGTYTHKCTCEGYKDNTFISHIEAKERENECTKYSHRHLVKYGFHIPYFIGLLRGKKGDNPHENTMLQMQKQELLL